MPPPRKEIIDLARVLDHFINLFCHLEQSERSQNFSKYTLAEIFSPYFKGQRKAAFTLAEVLITLGIIGIVAALTMPNLITKHRNNILSTQFKYAYNILYNTTNQLLYENDFTTWPGKGLNQSETGILEMYHKKIPNSILYNSTNNADIFDFRENTLTINNITITMNSYVRDCDFQGWQHGVNNMCLIVYVDTNSIKKGPNKPGYDRFAFWLSRRSDNPNDIRLVPSGFDYNIPDECTDTQCGKLGCRCNVTTRALQDSNYFKNLK